MKLHDKSKTVVRYQNDAGIFYGILDGEDIHQVSDSFLDVVNMNNELLHGGIKTKYQDVKILEPVTPSKIVNFGWTYSGHAKETGGKPDLKEPFLFLKPTSSLIPDHSNIVLPPPSLTSQVEMEGELALIIGKRAKNVKEEEALDYVFGYTVFNDVTARDLTKADPQFTRGKGFDTFGPLGPWIVTDLDPTNLRIVTRLNNKIVQDGNTNQMSLSIPYLISWISKVMTLEPGDVLATGSPSGSCPMKSGDVVVIEVEKIGRLRSYVQ